MSQFVIENIDPNVLEKLKIRAQRQGRTLEAELKVILEAAALEVTISSKAEEDRVLLKSVQKTPEELGYPPGFFERTYGCLADDPIVIDDQGISEAMDDNLEGIFEEHN